MAIGGLGRRLGIFVGGRFAGGLPNLQYYLFDADTYFITDSEGFILLVHG